MPIRWLALAVGLASLTTPALASTRVAVYAIVDEIDFEPSSFEPERAWISGMFVVPVPISSGLHAEPARGHLYFSVNPSDPNATRRDWEALKAIAGSGTVVGFGEYWMRCSLVRSAPLPLPPDAENANCSTEITVVETDRTRATAEPYPKPSSEGVVTVFDGADDICPRFGQSSVQIVAQLRVAHSPGGTHETPPVCVERIGLVDSSDLDFAFVDQTRDDEWADATETLILKRVAGAPGLKLSDLRVECRDTICRIHAAFPTHDYQEATGNRLFADALQDLPGFAPGGKIIPPRDAPTIDYYYQRRSPHSSGSSD
ncbi:MAG TPA: hypothetical protein VN818_04990 [Gammaproteobacteria bacterium]|nr:hypothetical protein [Gammaproteobacteria bacterium]